jgi:hypothetical protein
MNPMNDVSPYTQQPLYAPSAFMRRDSEYDIHELRVEVLKGNAVVIVYSWHAQQRGHQVHPCGSE